MLNSHLRTVTILPLTTGRAYSFRIPTQIQGKKGVAAIDQIRTVDKLRLVKKITTLNKKTAIRVLQGIDVLGDWGRLLPPRGTRFERDR